MPNPRVTDNDGPTGIEYGILIMLIFTFLLVACVGSSLEKLSKSVAQVKEKVDRLEQEAEKRTELEEARKQKLKGTSPYDQAVEQLHRATDNLKRIIENQERENKGSGILKVAAVIGSEGDGSWLERTLRKL